jgi:hypothetical protein
MIITAVKSIRQAGNAAHMCQQATEWLDVHLTVRRPDLNLAMTEVLKGRHKNNFRFLLE